MKTTTYSMNWKTGKLEPAKTPELSVGQVVWLNGYGQNEHDHQRQVIYKIFKDEWGTRFHCVNLETFELRVHEFIRPASEIFGIGTYFTPGDIADPAEIEAALIKADEKRLKREADIARIEAENNRLKEQGKQMFDTIANRGYTAFIVAELERDISDIQSDYWGSKTERTIILAGSKHHRKIFSEFRKAALNCDIPEVRELATAPADWEHRENYSMGHGYYLGKDKYSGWHISKTCIHGWHGVESLYIAAAREGGFWIK